MTPPDEPSLASSSDAEPPAPPRCKRCDYPFKERGSGLLTMGTVEHAAPELAGFCINCGDMVLSTQQGLRMLEEIVRLADGTSRMAAALERLADKATGDL